MSTVSVRSSLSEQLNDQNSSGPTYKPILFTKEKMVSPYKLTHELIAHVIMGETLG